MQLVVNIDGGSRGNPGPASAGVVIKTDDGTPIHEAGYFLGTATNNVAEYTAFLRAIALAAAMKPERVQFFSDSELMVRQITGEYRVKSPDLKPLYERAQMSLLQLDSWIIKHVRRKQNSRADELANLAMDARTDVIVHDGSAFVGGSDVLAKLAPPPPVAAGPVTWTATLSGKVAACPAKHRDGQRFQFDVTTPKGCCIHAAAAILRCITDDDAAEDTHRGAVCDHCGVHIDLAAE